MQQAPVCLAVSRPELSSGEKAEQGNPLQLHPKRPSDVLLAHANANLPA